jgi:hypothetical protein
MPVTACVALYLKSPRSGRWTRTARQSGLLRPCPARHRGILLVEQTRNRHGKKQRPWWLTPAFRPIATRTPCCRYPLIDLVAAQYPIYCIFFSLLRRTLYGQVPMASLAFLIRSPRSEKFAPTALDTFHNRATHAIESGQGGVSLKLTPDQYARLRRPWERRGD